jgi:hypothetical protein
MSRMISDEMAKPTAFFFHFFSNTGSESPVELQIKHRNMKRRKAATTTTITRRQRLSLIGRKRFRGRVEGRREQKAYANSLTTRNPHMIKSARKRGFRAPS